MNSVPFWCATNIQHPSEGCHSGYPVRYFNNLFSHIYHTADIVDVCFYGDLVPLAVVDWLRQRNMDFKFDLPPTEVEQDV